MVCTYLFHSDSNLRDEPTINQPSCCGCLSLLCNADLTLGTLPNFYVGRNPQNFILYPQNSDSAHPEKELHCKSKTQFLGDTLQFFLGKNPLGHHYIRVHSIICSLVLFTLCNCLCISLYFVY